MATEEEIRNRRLWADTGTSADTLPIDHVLDDDIGIEDVFSEAAERYPNDAAKQTVYARVIVFRRLLAPSAFQTRYVQNQDEEDMEKIFDNLERQRDYWQKEVEKVSDPAEEDDTYIGGNFFRLARGQRGR